MKRWKLVSITVVFLLAVTGIIVAKGNLVGLIQYFGGGAYVGNAIYKDRLVINDTALLEKVTSSPDYQDFRRRHPDFDQPFKNQLRSTTTPQELERYKLFLSQFQAIKRDKSTNGELETVQRISQLVYRFFKKNSRNGRQIENSVLGKNRSYPEDYVYQLVNAQTACGTVGEATVALMRDSGFDARLVIISAKPNPLIASHITTEVYLPEARKWVMVDPMIDFVGSKSVFEILADAKIGAYITNKHGIPSLVDQDSVAWFDRRGPMRKVIYYTPSQKARIAVKKALATL